MKGSAAAWVVSQAVDVPRVGPSLYSVAGWASGVAVGKFEFNV